MGLLSGSQSVGLANWKEDIGKRTKKFKSSGRQYCLRLSALEPGHLTEFCLAEDNSPLLTETFVRLSRVWEVS
jgi:hypothetical protein